VYELNLNSAQRPEMLGTKEKFWLLPKSANLPAEPHLFKIGRPQTGENWSEKVCCELARTIGLPCAEYNFAIVDGRRGVISRRFFGDASTFFLGNVLLAKFIRGYDQSKTYKQVAYTLHNVLSLHKRVKHISPVLRTCVGIEMKEIDIFVGYLVFDAWIGNTDRHHENWGLVVTKLGDENFVTRLAPTFDHASSLGRELTDEKRVLRLSTNDKRADVATYVNRARSAFTDGDATQQKYIGHRDVLTHLMLSHPEATMAWAAAICAVPSETVRDTFERVDQSWISQKSAEFATAVLKLNAETIREICLG
jgi:hypothetical protein